jgi:hypothetical protein
MISRAALSTVVQGQPKYRSMLAGNTAFSPGAFESIATLSGNGAFTSIPSTYKNLSLIYYDLDSSADGNDIYLRVNGNATSGNYADTTFYNAAGTPTASSSTSLSGIRVGPSFNASSALANASGIYTIYNYTSTGPKILTGQSRAGSSYYNLITNGLLTHAAAISSITFVITSGTFTGTYILYGVS